MNVDCKRAIGESESPGEALCTERKMIIFCMWIELCGDKKRDAMNNSRKFDLHGRQDGDTIS